MKKTLLVSSLLGGLIVCSAAAPALAQDSTPPPAAPMSPPPAAASSSSSMGGGAIGVGAVTWLGSAANPLGVTTSTPIAGGEFVYDMPVFHLEGVFGFDHASNNGASATDVRFGVAGWYHLARGTNADFSIGGGAGLIYASATGAGNSATAFTLEPGAEGRVFLSPNFALSARVGFAITFGDNNAPTVFSLAGQTTEMFGFTYFFR
jgi:hypothetical protein